MSKFGFDKIISILPQIRQEAVQIMMQEAKKTFDESFDNEGIDGKKWKEVDRRIEGTRAYREASSAMRVSPILTGVTGRLKKNNRIVSVTPDKGVLDNDMSYADTMNSGNGSNVPARPFIKQTPELTRAQLLTLAQVTGRIFKIG